MKYDLSYLNDLLGDQDSILEMAEIMMDQTPADMNVLGSAIADRDFESTRINSHKIKSSLSIFGVERGRTLMETIESLARKQSGWETIDQLYREAGTEVSSFLNDLHRDFR